MVVSSTAIVEISGIRRGVREEMLRVRKIKKKTSSNISLTVYTYYQQLTTLLYQCKQYHTRHNATRILRAARWPKKEEGATNEEYRQMQDGKIGEISCKHFN